MDSARVFIWGRRVAICLTALAIVVAARVALKQELQPKRALELLRSVQHEWWGVPTFAAVYLALTGLAVPVVLFHMVSGAAFGFPLGLATNIVVFNIAVSLQFLAARHVGRAKAEALVARFSLQRFTQPSRQSGFRTVLSLRLLPLPSIVTCIAAVLAGVRWRDFAFGSLIGAMPSIVIYTYFAAALVEGAAGAERDAVLHTLLAAGLIALVTFLPGAIRKLRGRQARPTTPT